ncbi:MAG: efflux RND transporter periplasmic adaptor subunit [Acidobacteriaceae bacterium]|nr:efflux RND transporter periplasmic adaptor subunit [Acidobacteriaceae bacterium]
MAATNNTNSRISLWIVLVLVVAIGAYYLLHGRDELLIRTATVEREDLLSTLATNGKVEPVEDFQAHATASAVVDHLYVSVGQHVAKNQLLMQLDASEAASKIAQAQTSVLQSESALKNMKAGGSQEELLSAKADLSTAEDQAAAASAQLKTLQALATQGNASPAEVAQAQQRLNDANARVSVLKVRASSRYSSSDMANQQAQIAQSRAALSAARTSYDAVAIRAPFDGTVYSLPISQYDYVQAGEALLDVADLTHLQVRAYFDEPEIGKLAKGQPVKIVWDAMPDRTWHGHILQAPTTVIAYGTRNVGEALISVDDPDGVLLPNTNVTVTVITSQHPHSMSLPREALHTEGLNNFVYRVVNGRLVRTEVKVGVVNLTRVEILGGISEHDLIATRATTPVDLSDGLRVKPQQ